MTREVHIGYRTVGLETREEDDDIGYRTVGLETREEGVYSSSRN